MPTSSLHEVKTLIASFHPLLVVETGEEERVSSLLFSAARDLHMTLFEWSITRSLRRVPLRGQLGDKLAMTDQPLSMVQHIEGLSLEGIFLLKDFVPHLENAQVARALREVAQKFTRTRSAIVITGKNVSLPSELEHLAVHYELELPKQDELRKVFESVVASLQADQNIRIDLLPDEQEQMLQALRGLTLNEARQAIAHAAISDGRLDVNDIETVVGRKAQLLREGGVLEYFPASDNAYKLAGFGKLKTWLERAHLGFSSEAQKLNLTPPKGVLMVGVQGCGKSLAAKYIAREWRMPLIKLDAGAIYDKYIGESEKNMRRAISQAEAMAPAVLWIDEIEKAITPGGSDMDGGLSKRLFAYFLTWLQEKRADIFVVATANDLSALPPELMRKGRFDEIFFVDLPTAQERDGIFRVHLELRQQNPATFDLHELVLASEGFSGAEIEQATIASLYRALHEKQPLSTGLILDELASTVPLSVSRREDMDALRSHARERFAPVS